MTEIIHSFENSRRDARLDRLTPGVFARVSLAQFIEDVNAHVEGKTIDEVMTEMRRRYSQYKRLEAELQQQRIRLSTQLPDVRRSLEAVETLVEKRERGDERGTTVKYQLTEGTFADAEVGTPESVYLWLGANVMLEYPLDEAKELLETNVKACESGLEANARDLAVLKDNVTVMEVRAAPRERERENASSRSTRARERHRDRPTDGCDAQVNMARVYNHDVRAKKEKSTDA